MACTRRAVAGADLRPGLWNGGDDMNSQPTLSDVFSYLEFGFEAAVDELASLVRIPGVSAQPTPELELCAEAVRDSMLRSGLSVTMIEGFGPTVVYGERIVDPALPTVLIYGHYDVQPAESEGWNTPPFEPVVIDGRMYGRGSSDNKGQHLAHLWALRATLAVHGELPVNVKLLV